MKFGSKLHEDVCLEIKSLFPGIKVETEHPLGNRLFLDIFLPDYGIGIEVDGPQHDHFNDFFHNGQPINFAIAKMLDKKKEIYCKENGISLFRIKHNIDNNELGMIILRIFRSYNNEPA
jgi:very-short-patch-repair endonuclease